MSKFIIHSGSHKTGTSHLQAAFDQNADLMKQHGVVYPPIWSNGAHHVMAAPWKPHVQRNTKITREDGLEMYKKLVKEYAKTDATVVISGEVFTHQLNGLVDYKELAMLLEPFDSVEIVNVVREQVALFQSTYLQLGKTSRKDHELLKRMLDEVIETQRAMGVALNFGNLLDQMTKGFDESSIFFSSFEVVRKMPMGVLTPVVERFGWDKLPEGFKDPVGDINVSPDPLSTLVAQELTGSHPPPGRTIDVIRKTIDAHFSKTARTTILEREQAEMIATAAVEWNQKVLERVGDHCPNLAFPDYVWNEELITASKLDTEFYKRLSRRLIRSMEQASKREKGGDGSDSGPKRVGIRAREAAAAAGGGGGGGKRAAAIRAKAAQKSNRGPRPGAAIKKS